MGCLKSSFLSILIFASTARVKHTFHSLLILNYFPFFDSVKKMRVSTMSLICRGFDANKTGTFTHPLSLISSSLHNLCHKNRPFSSKPRIDFSCIHEVDDAVFLFREMLRMLAYDVVTFNTMLHGLFLACRFAEGLKLFKDMQAQQLTPDLLTYNTILKGLCMNKQIAEAFSFLHVMEEKGVNPDTTTYSIIIYGLCKDGKLGIARNLFNSLPSKGLQPNIQMCTIIIGSLCQGLVEEAKYLLKEMERNVCAPDSVTYNVCIQGLLKRKLLAEAKAFLDEMHRRGFSPDATTVSLFLENEGFR